MNFGLNIPTASEGYYYKPPFASPEQLTRLIKATDHLGFKSAWVNERFNMPRQFLFSDGLQPSFLEVLVTLAYFARVTQRISLVTGVLQPGFREPVLLAKQIATLDAFSGSRFILGIGKGDNRLEFESINPRKTKISRGTLLDEILEAVTLLLNNENVSYEGKRYEFRDVSISPRPLRNPFPIYLAGRSNNPNTMKE